MSVLDYNYQQGVSTPRSSDINSGAVELRNIPPADYFNDVKEHEVPDQFQQKENPLPFDPATNIAVKENSNEDLPEKTSVEQDRRLLSTVANCCDKSLCGTNPVYLFVVCCCVGIGLLVTGAVLISGDGISNGECVALPKSWTFTCLFDDGDDVLPRGWFTAPVLAANWDDAGRLGVPPLPNNLLINSKCEGGNDIGRYTPNIPLQQCNEFCTNWCRVQEQQLLKETTTTGILCCEAVMSSSCTCAARNPSSIVVGNSSSMATEYELIRTKPLESPNKHCSNTSVFGLATEDECYLRGFRTLIELRNPIPCYASTTVTKGVKFDKCSDGYVVDDANPDGLPVLIVGAVMVAFLCCLAIIKR